MCCYLNIIKKIKHKYVFFNMLVCKDLYNYSNLAKEMFEEANSILGFPLQK